MPHGVYDRGDPIARFWTHVDKNGPTMPHMTTPCWVWTGGKTGRGYGVVGWGYSADRTRQVNKGAHVAAFIYTNGPVPDGLDVCHKCDNPPCCRPDHLHVGTRKQNMQEARQRGRLPEHPNAKLKEEDVRAIREARAAGASLEALAQRYGVCLASISNIAARRSWTSVA